MNVLPGEALRLREHPQLDPSVVETPAYVLEESRLRANAEVLHRVQVESGAKILLALKGFAFWRAFDAIKPYFPGMAASSLHEAMLAREQFGGELHMYAPAYSASDFLKIVELADHVVFNSFSQWRLFRDVVGRAPRPIRCGIRVNPEHSESKTGLYDPCGPFSRLGVTLSEFREDELGGITGLHFHNLCECGVDALERTLTKFEDKFGRFFSKLRWVNFGGGHLITDDRYDVERLIAVLRSFRERHGLEVYLEPSAALGWRTGTLVASVLDIMTNEVPIAILDTSATAHMPDCLEMPYRPSVRGAGLPNERAYTYRLGGLTCLAGDVIGEYSFDRPLEIGSRIVFEDMIHYTIVKNTTFNGVGLPMLAVLGQDGQLSVARRFGYEDYKSRNG